MHWGSEALMLPLLQPIGQCQLERYFLVGNDVCDYPIIVYSFFDYLFAPHDSSNDKWTNLTSYTKLL